MQALDGDTGWAPRGCRWCYCVMQFFSIMLGVQGKHKLKIPSVVIMNTGKDNQLLWKQCVHEVKGKFSHQVPHLDSPISDVQRTHSS